MKNLFSLMIVLLITIFTLVGCSDDNSTNPNQDFNNLEIPDGFNWTNLDYIQLNIALDDATIIAKNAVIVSHGEKVLAKKFLQNGRLEMNINSIKGYHNLVVEVPAYGFSEEIATNVKEHNLVVATAGHRDGPDESNDDPYFKDAFDDDDDDDDDEFENVSGIPQSLIDEYWAQNIYIPTKVPEEDEWVKYKFGSGNGKIKKKKTNKKYHLTMGTDWILMQTIELDDDDCYYYNEFLSGETTNSTANLNDCPAGSYLTTTYLFLNEDMNFISLDSKTPHINTNPNHFSYDSTLNRVPTGTEYVVIIGQYNGPTGEIKLNSWQLNFYETECEDPNNPQEPEQPVNGSVSVPGGLLMFEDLWPSQGDYDFNDLYVHVKDSEFVINTSNETVYIDLEIRVLTVGASIHNSLGVRFVDAVNDGGEVTYQTFDEGRMLSPVIADVLPEGDLSSMAYIDSFDPNSVILFQDVSQLNPAQNATIKVRIYFDPTEAQPVNPVPDFFLCRTHERQLEVHLAGYPPTPEADMTYFGSEDDSSLVPENNWYRTSDNYPWALYFATHEPIPAPKENVPIFRAYPNFKGWVISGGDAFQNWTDNPFEELTETPWE